MSTPKILKLKSAVLWLALSTSLLQACAPASGSPAAAAPADAGSGPVSASREDSARALQLFDTSGGSNPLQTLDDLNYSVSSGLLASTIASGNCVCQFVEGLDPKECLSRVQLQDKADLLIDVSLDAATKTVTAKPNWLAQLLVWGGGPQAVAKFDLDHPEYGCMVVSVAKK